MISAAGLDPVTADEGPHGAVPGLAGVPMSASGRSRHRGQDYSAALRDGPRRAVEVARAVGAGVTAARRTLERLAIAGRVVRLEDGGRVRYALSVPPPPSGVRRRLTWLRGECAEGPRPCQRERCRYWLASEGPLFPSCVLDVADGGPRSTEAIAALLGVTRQGVEDQLRRALASMRRAWVAVHGEEAPW